MNRKENQIWCHYCFKWIDKFIDVLVLENDVYCLLCYDENKYIKTHLGYEKEL